jgi:guanylate kinase
LNSIQPVAFLPLIHVNLLRQSHALIPVANSLTSTKTTKNFNFIVFTGPSGVGKGTVLRAILARHPDWYLSTSATTRSPRPGEIEGKHYYFLSRPEFEAQVAQGEFLEWAEFAGNFYGTPRQPVMNHLAQGERVILEIELEGARQVRYSAPEAVQIFMKPPSLEILEARIRSRGQDSEEAIQRRLARAKIEIASADEFDIQIINDDLERAIAELETLMSLPCPPLTIETSTPILN